MSSRKVLMCSAAGFALLLNASISHAQLDKCEAKLEGCKVKWVATATKTLGKCKAAMRKQTVLEGTSKASKENLAKAAAACEGGLAKLFGGADAKFLACVDGLFAGGKCTAGDLAALGHLVSGPPLPQAPGTATQDWVKHWLKYAGYKLAIKDELFVSADFFNQVSKVQAGAGGCPAAGANFCKLKINCREHECELSAASQTSDAVGGGALTISGLPILGSTVFEACKVEDPFNFDPGFFYIVNEPSRTNPPVNLLGNTICIDGLKSEGWCNCTGAPVPIPNSTNFCEDHNALAGAGPCPGGATGPNTVESGCKCSSDGIHADGPACGPGIHFCAGAEGVCGRRADGGFCHPGTTNSAVFVAPLNAATVNGGCVDFNTIGFTTLPPGGNCGNGNPASFGPDCTPCTEDDLVPPAASASIPFTTGTAAAQVLDAVLASGNCSNAADATTQCIENVNCGANPNDVCVGAIINPNENLPAVVGSPIDPNKPGCPDLEASVLAGLKFVGAFPALDGAGLGDVVSTFVLGCQ